MREEIANMVKGAALTAGLPAASVIDIVKKDNLTLARPRMELQYLPEKLTRTGRKLGIWRTLSAQFRKLELYEVQLSVSCNVLAEDAGWLADFCHDFLVGLPRGFNDRRGNWVRIRAARAEFGRPPDRRVGDAVIEVFTRVNELLVLDFVWRITDEEVDALIPEWNLELNYK